MSAARVVLAAGLVLLAQLVDVTVLAREHWPLATPDLTLLVVVALALLGGSRSGATAGLAAGLLVDLTPPGAGPLGLTAVAYGLAGLVAGRYHRPGERSLLLVLLAGGAAGATSAVVQALAALADGASFSRALGAVVGGAAYALVASLVVVPLVVVLDRWVEGEPVEVARL